MKDYALFFPNPESEKTLIFALKKYQERRKKDFEDIDREIKEIETALKKPDPKSEKKLLIRLKEFKEYRLKVQNEVPKEVSTALEKPDPKYVYEHYEIFCQDDGILEFAASCDCVPIFKLCLEKLKHTKFTSFGKPVPIEYYVHTAATSDAANIVRYLKPYVKNINYMVEDSSECTILYWAAQGGKQNAIKALLEYPDIDLDARDDRGITPVERAYHSKHLKIVEILLKAGAKPGSDIFVYPYLGFIDLAGKQGLDFNYIDAKTGITPLHAAVSGGDIDAVRKLIEFGAKTDILSRKARGKTYPAKITAIQYAVILKDKKIQTLLNGTLAEDLAGNNGGKEGFGKVFLAGYKKIYGKPDSIITLKSASGTTICDLAIAQPKPKTANGSVVSLGLSAHSKKATHNVEFITAVQGKLSDETAQGIAAACHSLFLRLDKEEDVITGSIFRSISFPPFDKMSAVMIINLEPERPEKDEDQYEETVQLTWLDEKNETGRLMQLVPLFEEEADELEQYEASFRNRWLIKSGLAYADPARKPIEIGHAAFTNIWKTIALWYKANKAADAPLLEKILQTGFDPHAGDELEKKLGLKLSPDFKASFNVMHGKISVKEDIMLDKDQIIQRRDEMNTLNKNGGFKKNSKNLDPDEDRVLRQWWHEKWIPVSRSRKDNDEWMFIDLSPTARGTLGQVGILYSDWGPRGSGYESFFKMLYFYNKHLWGGGWYEVDKAGQIKTT